MELQIAFSATGGILLITITIIFLLSLHKLIYNRSKPQNLPPGPWKLPIIGSMHHLMTRSLPHHALKNLSMRNGPLMHLKLGEISAVVVSSPQMAKLFMKTHDRSFGARPSTFAIDVLSYNKSDILFAPCNDHWRHMRKICGLELLSNTRVKSFSYVREDEVANMIANIRRSAGSLLDLRAQLFTFSGSVICRAAFSEKFLAQSSLISLVNEASMLMAGFSLSDFFPSFKFLSIISGVKSKVLKVHQKIDKMLDDIVRKHREKDGVVASSGQLGHEKEDLLDVLLRLQQGNEQEFPISDEIIKAVLFEIFAGGTETAPFTVECAMAEMIKEPRVLEKAQLEVRRSLDKRECVKDSDTQGLHYLELVIKETLRLHPPVPLLVPRECTETCEINGYTIPAKTKVIINAWAIGRDPESWEDAEKFIPERFEEKNIKYNGLNFEFIPFGAGRRICPGASFALVMVELILAQLLYHFNWKLPDGVKPEELDMVETEGVTTKRRTPLCLIADVNEDEATLSAS